MGRLDRSCGAEAERKGSLQGDFWMASQKPTVNCFFFQMAFKTKKRFGEVSQLNCSPYFFGLIKLGTRLPAGGLGVFTHSHLLFGPAIPHSHEVSKP